MKGVLKGSLFSLILIFIIIGISALINMKLHIPPYILKGILWTVSCICIFAGVLPVTKSASEGKFFRGIGCAFVTVLFMLIAVSAASGHIPTSGSFYAYALICMLCGLLGAVIGINI